MTQPPRRPWPRRGGGERRTSLAGTGPLQGQTHRRMGGAADQSRCL